MKSSYCDPCPVRPEGIGVSRYFERRNPSLCADCGKPCGLKKRCPEHAAAYRERALKRAAAKKKAKQRAREAARLCAAAKNGAVGKD